MRSGVNTIQEREKNRLVSTYREGRMNSTRKLIVLFVISAVAVCQGARQSSAQKRSQKKQSPSSIADAGWPVYGRDAGGARYSPLAVINRENINRLKIAWTYRTGALEVKA